MKNVLIIAEAGVNHNGNLDQAKSLIDVAADAGADYVKFQTFNSKLLVSKAAKKAKYQIENTGNEQESQLSMLQKLELSREDHYELIAYCNQRDIKFLSTGFDLESLDFLNSLNIEVFKIPSGELTNLPYLRQIASFNRPIILSTGMADMQEIRDSLQALLDTNLSKEDISILHCSTEYPTPIEDVNLMAMVTIAKEFGVTVGYSDHTLGISVPIAAVALGAKIIEKHFTLDRTLPGPDHRASLEPEELKSMVRGIREIEQALGNGKKEPSQREVSNKKVVRKSIVASRDIAVGELFTVNNITVKRPGTGISPMRWDEVLGTKAKKDYSEDDLI